MPVWPTNFSQENILEVDVADVVFQIRLNIVSKSLKPYTSVWTNVGEFHLFMYNFIHNTPVGILMKRVHITTSTNFNNRSIVR